MLNLSLSIDTLYWHIGWLYILTYLSVVIFFVQLHIISIFHQFVHGVGWGTVASLGLLGSCLWWSSTIYSAFYKVNYFVFCFFPVVFVFCVCKVSRSLTPFLPNAKKRNSPAFKKDWWTYYYYRQTRILIVFDKYL
jgi:hypothetical protein